MAGAPDKSADRIAGMFDAIAPRYDLLNHLLSAGIDRRWRAAAIRSLQLAGGETLVDVCCGTADVALEARRGPSAAAHVVGVDFSGAMLGRARQKVGIAGELSRIALIPHPGVRTILRVPDPADGGDRRPRAPSGFSIPAYVSLNTVG